MTTPAEHPPESADGDVLARARAHAIQMKAFWLDLASFVFGSLVVFVINLVTSPGNWWFYWVTVFWGIGVLGHAYNVFIQNGPLGPDYEERKVRE